MIIQNLLDFLSQALGNFLHALPPIPPEIMGLIDQMAGAGETVGNAISRLGPIVPLSVISSVMTVWLIWLGMWALFLVVRMGLWIVNR